MSVFNNNLLLGAGGQGDAAFNTELIPNSVWLDGSADFLKQTFGSASNQKRFVLGTWIQRNKISSSTVQNVFATGADGSNGFFFTYQNATSSRDDRINIFNISGGSLDWNIQTSARFRDIAYYHILLSYESAASTSTDRVQIFINGVLQTSLETASFPSSGFDCDWGAAQSHCIGNNDHSTAAPLPAYLTQTIYLDGKSIQNSDVAVTDFLEAFSYGTNGSQFVPKADASVAALASTAGGNSFCLDFANSSDLGNDISSNNNDFTPTSMAAANQSTNTPSLVFPVLNAIDSDPTLAASLGFGNRLGVGVSDWDSIFSTLPMGRTGKWYFEVRLHTDTGSNGFIAGIHDTTTTSRNFANYIGNTTATFGLGYSLYTHSGNVYTNGGTTASGGSTLTAGDVVMMAVDLDNNKLWYGENGTFYTNSSGAGNPATGANPSIALQADTEYVFGTSPSSSEDYFVNFGADSTFGGAVSAGNNADANGIGDFKHAPPAGFLCLCSANLTAPEFQGADFFNTNLYTGNGTVIGSGGKAVTGVGFKPDWSWIKNRDASDSHSFYDLVRGTTKQIESDNTSVQTTEAEGLTTFGTDGFTVGNLAQVNTNTENYVSWNWLGNNATESISASGANPTLASTNTASDSGAFGICTYTGNGTAGSTVKHSLGGVPDMIMFKRFGATTTNWVVYFKELGAGNSNYLMLDLALAEGGAGAVSWLNSTAATSTLVTLGSDGNNNASDTFIMYLFRNVPGVCKVGSYTGNASNPGGPYISCGFTPRWLMFKSTGTNSWTIFDTARDPINGPGKEFLHPDLTSAAARSSGSLLGVDFLADGFRVLTTGGNGSSSGVQYVYMAMADIGGNGTLPPIYGQ